ncbi:hypothetical protein F3Y22_tig00116996pilonHSYRG00571 [Hibiscus syriacus]|uniref:Uncharacterized protein n=1 Tax=Hibiscus syriacus TaxID=106335 RepID=A0A6A2XLM9_HIBSY|nr:hypothetical protein F3Y22_tig00116996pilonHSYRG00571 [Hibiscus syriacus]
MFGGLMNTSRGGNSPITTPNLASVVVPPLYAALLTPQGRLLYDLFLYRLPRPEENLDRIGSGPGSGSDGSVEILADVDMSILDELLVTLKKYRLRSKVDIENVAEDFCCWQRYGGNLSGKTPAVEEPEAASVGWGSGVDGSSKSASLGSDVGCQWFKDPRLDCLGARGIFPSAPLVESDKETDEENYLMWRLEKGVGEGLTEIPKATHLDTSIISEVEGKFIPESEVIDTVTNKRLGNVATALGFRGMDVLRLDNAFKDTSAIQGQEDIKVMAIRSDLLPAEWFQDQHTATA